MSSRRSSSSRAAKIITQQEMNHLILKLKPLPPQLNPRQNGMVSSLEILKETCDYIMRLQGEADDMSERLSQHLDSMDSSNVVDMSLMSSLQSYSL